MQNKEIQQNKIIKGKKKTYTNANKKKKKQKKQI